MDLGVALEPAAIKQHLVRLSKKRPNMARLRAKALNILAQHGQVVLPPDGMPLWEFFKT